MSTTTTEQNAVSSMPRLKERYREEIVGKLRDKKFMKIISLAPEVL